MYIFRYFSCFNVLVKRFYASQVNPQLSQTALKRFNLLKVYVKRLDNRPGMWPNNTFREKCKQCLTNKLWFVSQRNVAAILANDT
jgi:hypothetical protein